MKRKKVCSLLLAVMTMTCVALSGCGDNSGTDSADQATEESVEEENDAPAITDGIYENTDVAMKTFLHFNEDGTYYGYFFDGGVIDAGTWELLDEELDYTTGSGDDGKQDIKEGTAPQVILMTSYQSGWEPQKCAYDPEQDALLGIDIGNGMMTKRTMTHNAEYAYDPAVDEQPLAIQAYHTAEDEGATLTLYHDMTFVDYTGDMGEEGTWTEGEKGSYTLTTDEAKEYTLTVNADGTATYTKDGAAVTLTK